MAALGSIPACAGEPPQGTAKPDCRQVYPRVCGGTFSILVARRMMQGLSPRVRGNPRAAGPAAAGAWSIPACAGEPICCWRRLWTTRVYPRVCGGTRPSSLQSGGPALRGLSPRVRGNRRWHSMHSPWLWSIPACAGEPGGITPAAASVEVYPRVCGGTTASARMPPECTGLSPRVRGNPPPLRLCRRAARSIPACAGEPSW